MEYVSLFPVDVTKSLSATVASVIRETDGISGSVFISPSVTAIQNLVLNGAELSVAAKESPYTSDKSQVRKVSISGDLDRKTVDLILRRLLEKPIRCERVIQRLHIHFDDAWDPDEGARSDTLDAELFEIVDPRLSFSDLIVPEDVKRQLTRALLAMKYKEVLNKWGMDEIPGASSGRASLNFIGPSGTGKTLAAHAIAGELKRTLIVVDYAGLESKYVGETSKHIKEVFRKAKECDAVLFFDEADSFLGRRIENVEQSYDAAVNNTRSVMLMEMQAHDGFLIFATNLSKNYDPAFRRRILDHIQFPLPGEAARESIFTRQTPARLPGREDIDFALLAAESEGLSGGDIANVGYQACIRVLERYDSDPQTAAVSMEDFQDALRITRNAHRLIPDSRFVIEGPGIADSSGQ